MLRVPSLIAFAALLSSALVAFTGCSDNNSTGKTPTPTTAAATTAAATTAAASSTATAKPSGSATGSASATATVPADGTVDPLGSPSTETVTTKPTREDFTGNLTLADVRIGVHPELGGWDRIVFEFKGTVLPGATIGYVDQAVQCGSGKTETLKGTAILHVKFDHAQAHDDAGNLTVKATQLTGPGTTIIESRQTCDFEGVVAWDSGIKGKQPFKVTRLDNPPRLVVDVKQ